MFQAMSRIIVAAAVFSASCAIGCPMLLGEPGIQEETGDFLGQKNIDSDAPEGTFEQQMPQPTMIMAQQIPNAPLTSNEEPVNVEQEGNTPQQISEDPPSELQVSQQQQLVENIQPSKADTIQADQSSMTMQSVQPAMTMQSEQPTMTVQPEQPNITMQSDQPAMTMQSQQPTITMQPEQPTMTMQPEQPTMTMQPEQPTMTMQSEQPNMTMMPDPSAVTNVESNPSQIMAAAQTLETQMQQLCPPANDCPEKETETPSSPSVQTPPATSTEPPQATAKHIVVMEPGDQKNDKFEIASTPSTP